MGGGHNGEGRGRSDQEKDGQFHDFNLWNRYGYHICFFKFLLMASFWNPIGFPYVNFS